MPFADHTHFTRAARAVDDLLAHLTGDQWLAPTPCTGWTVADVTQHLIDVNLNFARQLDQVSVQAAASASTSGDLLGSYRRSTAALQQVLSGPGDVSIDIPAQLRSRVALRVADLLIHCWDIAVATGTPLHLAEDLCVEALAFAQSRSAALQRSGEFASPQPVDEQAPAIDRLAALSGRTPPGPRGDVRSPSTPNR